MTNAVTQLEVFAQVAVHHAAEVHHATLAPTLAGLALVDRIIDHEASRTEPARCADLADVYGAWFGSLVVRELRGTWVALDDPVAPRIQVGQVILSPIDIVRRRLGAPEQAPSLAAVYADLRHQLSGPGRDERAAALAQNRSAWASLAAHPRFAGAPPLPGERALAIAALDPWLRNEDLVDQEVLCLGAGGGRHGPLLARAGARVTVVDICDAQLEHDRQAARTQGIAVTTLCTSLDDLQACIDARFAVVIQPVSACYLPDLTRMHREIARVLRPGGLYVVQHKQTASVQADGDDDKVSGGYRVHQRAIEGLRLPGRVDVAHREPGTAEYLHTLETLIGGLCRAGFTICDLCEPMIADAYAPAGSAEHRALFLPPYVKIKARRLG